MNSYSGVQAPEDSRIRVLHIITGLGVGGAEKMLWKLLTHTDPGRFDMRVLSLLEEGAVGRDLRDAGIPVATLGLRSVHTPWQAVGELWRRVREIQPDIVQGWMYHGNLAAWGAQLMLLRKTSLIWGIRHSLHDLAREKRSTIAVVRLCAWLSRVPARVLYNSERARRQHEKFGYCADFGEVIPNGFDVDACRPCEIARRTLRSELKVPDEALLVGLVARFDPLKDHAGFLLAVALLGTRYPNVHFVLVGRGVERSNPRLQIDGLPLAVQARVHCLGERADIPEVTAALDVAVSASISEGFPNSIGEAMSCAIPCVVTNVGDSAHLLGECGRTVPPSDPVALAGAIGELLDLPVTARRRLGARARDRIIKNFSIATVVAHYQALYLSLHSQGGKI